MYKIYLKMEFKLTSLIYSAFFSLTHRQKNAIKETIQINLCQIY